MDVFKLDQSLRAAGRLGGAPPADKLTADVVSFGAGTADEFNLSFFDDTTTDTAGSESHDPPGHGFGDESCAVAVAMDTTAASTTAAAFREVRVQSPCTSTTYRHPVAYAGHVTAPHPPPPPPPPPPTTATVLCTNSTPSSSTTGTAPGQCSWDRDIIATAGFSMSLKNLKKLLNKICIMEIILKY